MKIILASSSIYRRQLLEKLHISVEICPPNIDESRLELEAPEQMALRLSKLKAATVAKSKQGIIIASDQVACLGSTIFGKPGSPDRAIEQLRQCSGNKVIFNTGLCVINTFTGITQSTVVPFAVYFRQLSEQEIIRYVALEQPLDCAGSFKSEGLGISLFTKLEGEDPNALVGLPLIALCDMLRNEGINSLLQ